jgi:hypothetical protein
MKRSLPIWLLIVIWLVIIVGFGIGWNQYRIWSDNRLTSALKTPTPAPLPTPSPSASPHATPLTSPGIAVASCTTADLSLTLGVPNGTAGTTYTPLILTNIGKTPCALDGFPGVSLVSSSGVILGQPASRDLTKTPAIVILTPSQKAHASIGIHDAGAYPPGTCSATSGSVRVYPPGLTTYLQVPFSAAYCGDWPVEPISPGVTD